ILTYVSYSVLTSAASRFLLVPPAAEWRELVEKTIDAPSPIYLNVFNKKSAYRRRLILASSNPAYYTNYTNNKVKICPEDKADKAGFIAAMKPKYPQDNTRRKIFGFFHPFAHAAGGGERVLWEAVKETLHNDIANVVAIYTGDVGVTPEQILDNASHKFQIDNLDEKRIVFVYLQKRHLITALHWPRFTLIGQAIGSLLLTWEAIFNLSPDVWCDTLGLPFGYPLVSLCLRIPIVSYVHYPVVSSDMLNKLNLLNVKDIGKYIYWSAFKFLYTRVGPFVDIIMTNSTWTHDHIASIWFLNSDVRTVYPPCGTEEIILRIQNQKPAAKEDYILKIAQFRPEKRDAMVLEEYAAFFKQTKADPARIPKLVLLGSTRGAEDEQLVRELRAQAETLAITSHVQLVVNAPYLEMVAWLRRSKYGLNAMWNEHFGIAVVEYLASGCIPLVHASAGPLADIVVPWDDKNHRLSDKFYQNRTGFFFRARVDPDYPGKTIVDKSTGENVEFSELHAVFEQICLLTEAEQQRISARGRDLALHKFSNKEFDDKWQRVVTEAKALEIKKRESRHTVDKLY
ncbi:glycosyltransferase family 4 protein, partial [Babjeviella inositovora NRRL Y-12698]